MSTVDVDFEMTGGKVEVEAGTLRFTAPGIHTGGGVFTVSQDAQLELAAKTGLNLFAGDYDIRGEGLVVATRSLISEGLLTVNMTGPGAFIIDGQQTGGFNVPGAIVVNEGRAEWRGGNIGAFRNASDAVMAITASPNPNARDKELRGLFENQGTVTHDVQASVRFRTLEPTTLVNEGLYLLRGTLVGNGDSHRIENKSGATIRLDQPGVTRSFGGRLDNQGSVEVVSDGTLIWGGGVEQFKQSVLFGTRLFGGKWVAENGGKIQLGPDDLELNGNNGVIIMRDDERLTNLPDADAGDSDIDFENTGTYELRGTTTFRTGGGFENDGALVIDPASTLLVNGQFESNTGSFNTINGLLEITGEFDNDGGSFSGLGTVRATDFNNIAGDINPGSSPGIFTIDGNYIQGEQAKLIIEIGENAHDVLSVSGNVFLDGLLELIFLDEFLPQPDDVFAFLEVGGTLSGNFDDVTLAGLPLGTTFDLEFDSISGTMAFLNAVVPDSTSAPEPSTFLLMLFGLAGVLGVKNKSL